VQPEPTVVLHVDDKHTWGGGQNQAYLLFNAQRADKDLDPYFLVQQGGVLHQRLGDGQQVIPCSIGGEWHLPSLWRLRRLLARVRPGIVFCHTPHAVTLLHLARMIGHKCPHVAVRRVDYRVRRLKYRLCVDHIVAISKRIYQVLQACGMPEERLSLIPSAIPPQRVRDQAAAERPVYEQRFKPRGLRVGSLTNLLPDKSIGTFLRAIARLPEGTRAACTFYIAGDGPERKRLEHLCRSLNIAEHVCFLGFITTPYGYVDCLDILVMPSRREGLGTTLLDAIALGTPVVAADTGGIPEIVEHMKNGVLFAPEDSGDLARWLMRLLTDGTLRRAIRATQLSAFPEIHTITANAGRYKQLIRRLVGSPKTSVSPGA